MPTSLVIGGAGFLGSHLVGALLAAGRRVAVLDDLSAGSPANLLPVRDHPQLEVVLDRPYAEALLADRIAAADEVFYLGGPAGIRPLLAPADGCTRPTELVLRLAAAKGVRLFLASSAEVYGKNPKTPLAEDDDCVFGPPGEARWVVPAERLWDELRALACHRLRQLPVVVGRVFGLVGPYQDGREGLLLSRLADEALAGGPVHVPAEGRVCVAHVADVARAVVELTGCAEAPGRAFNLGSDETVSYRALAETVVRLAGSAVAIEVQSGPAAAGAGRAAACRVPDLGRLRETIGFRPEYTLTDAVRAVVAWRRGTMAGGSAGSFA